MKKKYILLLVFIIFIAALACCLSDKRYITRIKRPDYNQMEQSYTLTLDQADHNSALQEIEITVPARTLKVEELPLAFEETFDSLCVSILGNNTDFHTVTDDLVFQETVGAYSMSAFYSLPDYSIIDCFGAVHNDTLTEKTDLLITIDLTYGEYSQQYILPVTVLPAVLTDADSLKQEIYRSLSEQDSSSAYLTLPDAVSGTSVSFYEKTGTRTSFLLFCILAAFIFFYWRRILLPKKQRERREEQLKMDYAEIVSKLSLLVGAGMSVSNAFAKIAGDYRSLRKDNRISLHYVYEEIVILVNRLASGVSEMTAYPEFGRACQLHCYIRLTTMLIQNVRKGNADLLTALRSESDGAFEDRKILARQAGEKAGTKLIIPMILMLTIVFIIIIVPAFLSM